MDIHELVYIIDQCNQAVEQYGLLPIDVVNHCMAAYETLKDAVADGDYSKYREWWDTNAEYILNTIK